MNMTPHRPHTHDDAQLVIRSSIGFRSKAAYVFTDHLVVMPAPHNIMQVAAANDLKEISRRRALPAIMLVSTHSAPPSAELRRFLGQNNIALQLVETASDATARQILTDDWQQRQAHPRPVAPQNSAQPT